MNPNVILTANGLRERERAPFDTAAWNRYFVNWVAGSQAVKALWNDKDGAQQVHMDPDGKTVQIAGISTFQASGLTVTAAAAFSGNVTLGDASTDTLTVEATATFKANVTFLVNVTIGDTSGDTLTVNATPTFNAGLTVATGVLSLPAGSAAAPSLAVGEATTGLFRQAAGVLGLTTGGTERARLSSGGLLMAAGIVVTLPNNTAVQLTEAGGTVRNSVLMDASDVTIFGHSGNSGTVVRGGYVRLQYATTTRIEVNTDGIGFYGSAPVAKPTVTGSRGGNAALADLLTELAGLGLITDSSSA